MTLQVVVSSLLSCPLIEDHPYDVYLYQLPIFSLLVVNTVFLVVIMMAVVAKLQSSRAGEVERLHYKSARALVIVIPLLGFTYILTMVGPSHSLHPLAHQIFQTARVCLLSTQGAVISLPYCYLNSEVQQALLARWRRWMLVRRVEAEYIMKTVKIDKIDNITHKSDV